MCFLTGLSKSTQLDTKFITIKISFFLEQRVKNRNCVHFRMFRLLKPNILLNVAPVDSIEPTNEFYFELKKYGVKIRIYKLVMILFLCCLIVA